MFNLYVYDYCTGERLYRYRSDGDGDTVVPIERNYNGILYSGCYWSYNFEANTGNKTDFLYRFAGKKCFIKVWIRYNYSSDIRQVWAESEPFVVTGSAGKSVLLEGVNMTDNFGITYEDNPMPFAVRVEGGFYPASLTPQSNDNIFKGQNADFTTLYSMPSVTRRLNLGGAHGIPDAFAEKINYLLSMDLVKIDGREYTKPDGARLEAASGENSPLRSWNIEMAEVKEDNFAHSEDLLLLDALTDTKPAAIMGEGEKILGYKHLFVW